MGLESKISRTKKLTRRSLIKGPKSAWICFCEEQRPRFAATGVKLPFGDICKKIAVEWSCLSPELRQPYTDLQIRDKQRYQEALANLTPVQLKTLRKLKRDKRRLRKLTNTSPVLSAYMHFVIQERAAIARSNPGSSFMDIGRMLGAAWRATTPQDKEKYKAMSTVA